MFNVLKSLFQGTATKDSSKSVTWKLFPRGFATQFPQSSIDGPIQLYWWSAHVWWYITGQEPAWLSAIFLLLSFKALSAHNDIHCYKAKISNPKSPAFFMARSSVFIVWLLLFKVDDEDHNIGRSGHNREAISWPFWRALLWSTVSYS